uniref:Uncharacterized protein n=1 Tax=Megaselia scalaris TaxID=36166 RepID=T1GVB1_MEGSC
MQNKNQIMADEKEIQEKTIAEDIVVTKYKSAGEIVNKTLKTVIGLCVVDASVRDICTKSDNLILEETGKVSFRFYIFFKSSFVQR